MNTMSEQISRSRILVVEDQADLRDNLADFLRLENFFVDAASSGREALDLMEETCPDLVLSDISMPEGDGLWLVKELKKNPVFCHIPVIFLTAWADRSNVRRGMEMGAADYITKPFQIEEVLGAVHAQLAKLSRAEIKLEKTRREVRKQVVGNLPHELLTPLNSILGPADLLRSMPGELTVTEIADCGKTIYSGAKNLERRVRNLLLCLELENGSDAHANFHGESASPEEAVKSTIAALSDFHPGAAERIVVSGTGSAIAIPQSQIEKVLYEILDNALKFSPPEETVRVEIENAEKRMHFRITDQGVGISSIEIADITQFVQFRRKLQEQQGLGLGLAIARRLLEIHDGRLEIESAEGGPTIVKITLPLDFHL